MRFIHFAIAIALTALTSACGASPTATMTPKARPATHAAASQLGAITMRFALPHHAARTVLATSDDIAKLVVTLKAGKVLGTQTITQAQLRAGSATARFDGLAAGAYEVDVEAFDVTGTSLASSSNPVSVTPGAVAQVQAHLQLKADTAATGSLALGVSIDDGDAPAPIASAEPADDGTTDESNPSADR